MRFPFAPAPQGGKVSPDMRGKAIGLFMFVLGFGGFGASFFANCPPDSSGVAWIFQEAGYAQWQFYDLTWEGQYLCLELFLYTRGWRVPPPSFLSLTLRLSTFGASLTKTIALQRVGERGEVVSYFGQLILARRELGFGSYLSVRISGGPSGVELGLSSDSLRVFGERTFYVGSAGGTGGPLVPAPPGSSVSLPSSPASSANTFRECQGMEDAPYVSPGRYRGELGWPGQGQPLDSKDWLRVNLNAGHILELRVSTPKPVSVQLLDPNGREVGRISGSGELGLTFQASLRGTHYLCLSIFESFPSFTYVLDISIRR